MREAVLLLTGLAGLALLAYLYRNARTRRRVQERLEEPAVVAAEEPTPAAVNRPFVRRHRVLPWLAGAALAGGLYFLARLPPAFACAFGAMVGLLNMQLETFLADRKTFRIQEQLADAIDLMVGALQAGAGALAALENATRETNPPLRPQLEEVLGRIRYGDDPQAVLRGLVARVPLEPFRLFASALSVHWETGGSLAPTLATVGRTIRDRIELSRRVRSLSAQARFSVFVILAVTYVLAYAMWRTDPGRMGLFLTTTVGQTAVALCVVLQAVGVVWIAALSRVRF